MIKKLLSSLLICSLFGNINSVNLSSNDEVYCSAYATFVDENNNTYQKSGEFKSLNDYLSFEGNVVSSTEKCHSLDIHLFQDNAKVVYRPSDNYHIYANGHSFTFVDSDGAFLKYVDVNQSAIKYMVINEGYIDPNHVFNVGANSELRLHWTIMDGGNNEYSEDVFNLYSLGKFNLDNSTIQNFKLKENVEIVDFVDDADSFGETYLSGDSNAIFKNISSKDNGIIRMESSMDCIEHVEFRECSSSENGGAVYMKAGRIANCLFFECKSEEDGGAIYATTNYKSSLNISDNTFSYNYAKGDGGAIYIDGDASNQAYINDCQFRMNVGDYGGAMYVNAPACYLNRLSFDSNNACSDGGALYFNQEDNCIYNSTFKDNVSEVDGGAICIDDDRAYMEKCTFESNVAHDDGGAIYVCVGNDDVIISGCSFINNHADDACDDVDGRRDTIIKGAGATISSGNVLLIVSISEAIVFAIIVLLILKKKKETSK